MSFVKNFMLVRPMKKNSDCNATQIYVKLLTPEEDWNNTVEINLVLQLIPKWISIFQ